MKQTAVEWLIKEIMEDQYEKAKSAEEWIKVFKEAKEMEKEQIIEAVSFGDCRGRITTYLTEEEYYQETFKSEQLN